MLVACTVACYTALGVIYFVRDWISIGTEKNVTFTYLVQLYETPPTMEKSQKIVTYLLVGKLLTS